jgi:hypothetical protein
MQRLFTVKYAPPVKPLLCGKIKGERTMYCIPG